MSRRKFIEEAAAAVCFVTIIVAMFVMLAVWG